MKLNLSFVALVGLLIAFSCTACAPRNGSDPSRAAVTMKIDLHSRPSFDSHVLCTLSPGEEVALLDSLSHNGTLWYLVQTPDGASAESKQGWIVADALLALDEPLKCFTCGA